MSRENILRVLAIGFSLVILLLAAVAYLGNSRSHEIQASAKALIRDHFSTGRRIDQLQDLQPRLGSLLLDVIRRSHGRDVPGGVDEFDRDVQRLVAAGDTDVAGWQKLGSLSTQFAAAARTALQKRSTTPEEIDQLEEIRDRFLAVASDLAKSQSARAASAEAVIERESADLIGESSFLLAACFLLAASCAILTMKVTNDSFRDLEHRTAELTQVSWHMLQGQEAAARRFAHEMHDELGQSLTALKTTLSMITAQEFLERREECKKMLEQSIRDVRELSQLLRPVILDDFGLDAALRWLAERFQERTGIVVHYTASVPERLAEQTETHLFRITQESLTNVARHSGATEVRISLDRDGSVIRLVVEDNGKGLPATPGPRRPSLGMIGMTARAAQAGGELRLGKSPLGGVRIEIEVPYRQPTDEPDTEDAYLIGG